MSKFTSLMLATIVVASSAPAIAQETRSTRQQERREQREEPSRDWHLYFSSGGTYSHRDPSGEESTDYYRIPMILRLSNGQFRISASMPYVFINGPGTAVDDDDDDNSGETLVDETRQGVGDLRITARYLIPEESLGGFELDLLGRVKIPTASESKGIGTGEFDYTVGAELSHEIGSFEPFISGQFKFNGDKPDVDYRNTVAASAGTGFRISKRTRGSVAWDYYQSRTRGRSGSHYLDGGLTTRLSRTFSLNGSGAVGLSKHATDLRIGTTITARLF